MTRATSLESLLAVLRAAGEETRLRILAALVEGELAVSELTQVLGQSQPRISRHLKLLQEAGLIERRREGAWAFFRLAEADFAADVTRLILDHAPVEAGEIALDRKRRAEIRLRRRAVAETYFAQNADAWDQLRAMHAPEAEVEAAALAMLTPDGEAPFERFVDLGAGTGQMLALFADRYRQGIGYDLNQQMLSVARAKLEAAGLSHATLLQADILRLPEADGAADAIICHQVLHFLGDPPAACLEAARVLAPGGKLLVVDFAPHGLEMLRERHAHRRLGFSTQEIETVFKGAGLVPGDSRHIPPPAGAEAEKLTVSLWLGAKPA